MTTHENAPPMDGWRVEARCCPFGDHCVVCKPEPPSIHEGIQLGEN